MTKQNTKIYCETSRVVVGKETDCISLYSQLIDKWLQYLHLLKHNTLSVGCTTEGIGLPSGTQMSLLVVLVGPTLVATVVHMLSGSTQTSRFACEIQQNTISIYIYYTNVSLMRKYNKNTNGM